MADEDTFLFTSESVNEGHPDKLADQVRSLEEREKEKAGKKKGIFRRDSEAAAATETLGSRLSNDRDGRALTFFLVFFFPFLSLSTSHTQVSDAILDACLEQDPDAKVRKKKEKETIVETEEEDEKAVRASAIEFFPLFVQPHLLFLTQYSKKKKKKKKTQPTNHRSPATRRLDADKCKVLVHLEEQSPDIGQGVHGLGTKSLEEIGAGDQGHMFG